MMLITLEGGKEVTAQFHGIACNSQLVDSDVNIFLKMKTGRSKLKSKIYGRKTWGHVMYQMFSLCLFAEEAPNSPRPFIKL